MSRSRGRRYNGEKKLNLKKVFAVIMVIVILIMFIIVIRTLLTGENGKEIASKTYFPSFQNEKYGVIDETGTEVIAPSYAEYIMIPNQKKDVFLVTYDVDYTNNTYHTKALNAKNEELFTQYEQVQAIENQDSQNNVFFNDTVLKVMQNGKYGLIDYTGKEVLPCEYDAITSLTGVENSLMIQKEGKVGLADNSGKVVLNPEYLTILAIGDNYQAGYIVENEQNQYGVVDVNGKQVLEIKYTQIKPFTSNAMYAAQENGTWELVGKDGIVVSVPYEDVVDFNNSHVIVKNGTSYGVMGMDGTELIAPSYEDLAFGFYDSFIVKQNGLYGIQTTAGETKVEPAYQSMSYLETANLITASKDGIETDIIANDYTVKLTGILSEVNAKSGYIRMRMDDDYHYYNLQCEEKPNTEVLKNKTLYLSKKDGKYGYVDSQGNVKVDYQYDDATEQNEYGYVAVKQNGQWGSLDKEGNVVVEPSVNLDSAIKVDFIGTWHLTNDLNMNLYTK